MAKRKKKIVKKAKKSRPKVPAKFHKYIFGVCKQLKRDFYIQEMTMSVCYRITEDDEPEGRPDRQGTVAASIRTDDVYLNFTVNIYKTVYEMWKKGNYKDIKEILIHEFCHILTDPLYKFAFQATNDGSRPHLEDMRERQTQRITNVVYALMGDKNFKI